MNFFQFSLYIDKKIKDGFLISITDETRKTQILFDLESKILTFQKQNRLTPFLQKHEYQFRKILHNKNPETFSRDFKSNL